MPVVTSAVTGVVSPLDQRRVPHLPQVAVFLIIPVGRTVVVILGGKVPIEVIKSISIDVKQAKTLPVCLLQSVQWQAKQYKGAVSRRYLVEPQKQPPWIAGKDFGFDMLQLL